MKRLLGIFGVFALAALACGSSNSGVTVSTPAPEGEETEAPVAEETEAAAVGQSRDNPAPAGSEVSQGDITIVITSVETYTEQVIAGNQFNATPAPGSNYLLVTVSVTCNAEKCSTFPTAEFSLVGDSGNLIKAEFAAGVDGLLEVGLEQLEGATATGGILFIAPDEETLLLVWDPMFGDTLYLALPQP